MLRTEYLKIETRNAFMLIFVLQSKMIDLMLRFKHLDFIECINRSKKMVAPGFDSLYWRFCHSNI